LRAGLLSEPNIIQKLNSDYICTWALPEEVQALVDCTDSDPTRSMAQDLLANYRPLVEIMVLDSSGVLKARRSMLQDLELPYQGTPEKALEHFVAFLEHPEPEEPSEYEPQEEGSR
jgi:hypothetical protein